MFPDIPTGERTDWKKNPSHCSFLNWKSEIDYDYERVS